MHGERKVQKEELMEDLQGRSDLVLQPYGKKRFEESYDVCASAIQINNFSCHGRKCVSQFMGCTKSNGKDDRWMSTVTIL